MRLNELRHDIDNLTKKINTKKSNPHSNTFDTLPKNLKQDY